jgi:NosR/NirI family transcriptional regulator, nitrous oxide reductase regulator
MSGRNLRFTRKPRVAGGLATAPQNRLLAAGGVFLLLFATCAFAEQRFPPPDFESGHQLPVTTAPLARALFFQYLDVGVLAACLGLAVWLLYNRRSRKGLVAL